MVTVTAVPSGSRIPQVDRWPKVRARTNEAALLQLRHELFIVSNITDATFSGWGGVTRGQDRAFFEAEADVEKEGRGLASSIRTPCALLETS